MVPLARKSRSPRCWLWDNCMEVATLACYGTRRASAALGRHATGWWRSCVHIFAVAYAAEAVAAGSAAREALETYDAGEVCASIAAFEELAEKPKDQRDEAVFEKYRRRLADEGLDDHGARQVCLLKTATARVDMDASADLLRDDAYVDGHVGPAMPPCCTKRPAGGLFGLQPFF